MQNDLSCDYDSLTLSERVSGLASARMEAIADVERGDILNPYVSPDPRYFAYRVQVADSQASA